MKIGIFDSGLGGLIIARAIHKRMPEYDYVYFGDTKRLPYGNKSHEAVFEFTRQAVDYLFRRQNCAIVIIACNTASARALRQIQQEYLPKNFPNKEDQRRVLGVLIPAAEEASKYKRVGVLSTYGTVASNTWEKEINKLNSQTEVFQVPAPMLVPLIEEREKKLAIPFIQKYLKPLMSKKLDALVLGCTHYPMLKKEIKNNMQIKNKQIQIISQDEIIPPKLGRYLIRHREIADRLSENGSMKILVTDKTQNLSELVKKWFGNYAVEVISDSALSS